MATKEVEEKEKSGGSKVAGWLKGAIGAVAGLLSGAVMMYVSPLIDKVVKPPKPVANFAVDHEGTTVTFHDRSAGPHTGWWDFGDGTPLVPVQADQDLVTHTYASPGEYTAKLSVQNVLGDESERVVNLHLEADAAHTDGPQVLSLDAFPPSTTPYAPATFHVLGKVKNAQVCFWDVNDGRTVEAGDGSETQERMLMFERPGTYLVKLVAFNGKQPAEKAVAVQVLPPPASGMVTAMLSVADQATHVETVAVPFVFSETCPQGAPSAARRFERVAKARPGYQIADVRLGPAKGLQGAADMAVDAALVKGGSARDLHLQMAPDRSWVKLTGEVLKPAGADRARGALPNVELPVTLVEEKRSAAQRQAPPVAAALAAPGTTMLMMPPLPPGWVDAHRQMRLELRDGGRVIWQDSQMPRNAPVTVRGRPYLLTATPAGNQVRVDLVEARRGGSPSAN